MKIIKILLIWTLAIFSQNYVFAETWDEPWQREIIKNADYFVLAKVISNVPGIGTEVEILKYFGEQKLEGKVFINGFSLLVMTSSSGHGVHLNFEDGETVYLLLNKKTDGNFAISTPTSGFALLEEGKVYATYRHSYHQALVPQDIYESTYSEIWDYYKTSRFNHDKMLSFINEYIAKEPAGFDEAQISTFFLQHVALETAYLLDIAVDLTKLKKFAESENFHSRVSAVQLMANSNDRAVKEYLLAFITSESNGDFEKVIAIWSLSKIGGEEYKEKMLAIADLLSDEYGGFGGNIMDPRVGTYFPSPRGAVEELR